MKRPTGAWRLSWAISWTASAFFTILLLFAPRLLLAQQQPVPPVMAPLPRSPSVPTPQVLPATKSIPYAFILSVRTPADPRKPIPFAIHLVDNNGRPAPAPNGLIVNLLVTTLRDLQQAKSIWVKEEAAWISERDKHPVITNKVATPPRVIAGNRDILSWGLPEDLASALRADAAGGPRPTIALDFFRTSVFELFQFPQGRDAVTMELGTSYTKANLTLAVQAAHLVSGIRVISVAVPQRGSTFMQLEPAVAAPSPKVIKIEVVRQDHRFAEGWWSYGVTASISNGTPPADCYVDLNVTDPLKFVDPETDQPKWARTRLKLPSIPAPSVTASMYTVTNVMPNSIPRRARLTVQPPHCQDFTLEESDLVVDIPPRPGELFADPGLLTTYAHGGSTTILFYVRDKQGVDMIPAMDGVQQDGQWQVVFSVIPQSAGVVDPPNYPLKAGEAIARASVRWVGPARAEVRGILTTTSSPDVIRGAATLLLMFPWLPFLISVVASPLTQALGVTRPLPDRQGLCIVAGLAWGVIAFLGWYWLGPVIQEVGIGPLKLGFSSGDIAGSFWLAVIVIVIATPVVLRSVFKFLDVVRKRRGRR